MELNNKIILSEKAEKEIINAARLGALANLTENSPALLSINDIAILLNRSYNYTVRNIISRPDFPRAVTVDQDKNSNKFYQACDFLKWRKANLRRIN
ncbi:hypothetical protein A4G19_13785 [Pasteurellaceae bacterium Macca]|nr:hypothetical protein [Pasteurellaceae bacterium Macca]MCK3656749.1 hypothetical protein [Pasteurellaceae bacterium Macca]